MRYDVKAMGIGEVLDQATTLFKNNFKFLMTLAMFLYIPAHAILLIHLNHVATLLPAPPPPGSPPEQYAEFFRAALPLIISPMTIGVVVLFLAAIITTNAAAIQAVANLYLGVETTPSGALRKVLPRMLSILWTAFLAWVAISGALCLAAPIFLLPILGLFLWLGLYAYIYLRFWLTTHIVLLENIRGLRGLARSGELMKGNYVAGFVLGFALFVMSVALGFVVNLVPVLVLSILAAVLIQAILLLFHAAATVIFYFSNRCKLENFDLTILANAVNKEEPTAPIAQFGDTN